MQKGVLQNSPPEFLIRGATHSIGCSHSPGHLRVSSYRDTAKLGVMGQRWCLPAHADRRTEILAAPGAVRIRDVASSPDLSHACTMLKRQGLHLRPLPKRRRTVVRQTSAAHRGQLAPSVAAWLAASGSARETFALEHFALAGEQPHHTCQVCQEAIRARLQRRSLLARQAAPEEDHAPPELVHLTPALAGSAQLADSSAWSPRSPPVSSTTPASFASPDATLSGGTPPRTYWTDVGRAAWEAYWELRSESASTTSRDSGRVPDEFLESGRIAVTWKFWQWSSIFST
eukprot:COSAG03_NODE_3404_length_2038_cov_16.884477_1_plen_287_part_00